MKTTWDPKAKSSFRQIAKYIQRQFGSTARKNFIEEVKEIEGLLTRSPYVGKIDPLFADRPRTYRSVIINNLSTSRCGTRDMNLVPCPVVPCLVSIQYAV